MMMKPIKCKKLAVSRVSSPPRCSKPPGVPFTDEIHFHLFFDARIAAPVLIAAVSDSANTSAGIIGNRAAQKALVLTQSISPVSCDVIATCSSFIRAAFSSSLSYRELFIIMSNIDRFDEIAGQVFADLYNTFPLTKTLGLANYIEGDSALDPDGFTGAELTAEAEFVKATITWLINAGFLSSDGFHGEYFMDVILTPKGLECLKLMPDSLTSPAGNELTKAVKSGSKETLKMITNHVLALGVKIMASKYGLTN
ncbi:hypothetical protein WMA84_001162 [Enterobacter hormaechei subsp. xiangfangensis]